MLLDKAHFFIVKEKRVQKSGEYTVLTLDYLG